MREIKIRKLNKAELRENKQHWLYFNLTLPILSIIIIGVVILFSRKIKFNKKPLKIHKTYSKK